MTRRLRPLFVAVAAAVGLNACSSDKSATNDVASIQLSGVVAKGIVVGGRVTAYPIDSNGFVNIASPLGFDDTDDKGEYSIEIGGYSGPISLVMKPVAGSKTKCDVPTGCSTYLFGALMPLNFTMEAVIPKNAGGAVSASVTPLTTMAAAYAKDLGLSSESAQKANEKVAKLLGLTDILTTRPVDVTDNAVLGSTTTSADALKYGYLAAAIAQIAKTDNNGDVGSTIGHLSSSFVSNGGELVNKEASNDLNKVTLLEIASGAKVIIDANTSVTTGFFGNTKTAIGATASTATAATAGSITTTVTDTVITGGDVTKAKAIVTELRTWAQTARTELTAQVNNSSSTINVAKKVDVAMTAGNASFTSAFDAAALVGEAVGEAYVRGNGTWPLATLLAGNPSFSGTGNVVVNGTSIAIVGAKVKGNDVDVDLTAPVTSGMLFRLTTNSFKIENPGVTWTANAAGFIELQFDKNITSIQNLDTETSLGGVDLTPVNFDTLSKLTKVTWNSGSSLVQKANGAITDPVSFTGTTSAVAHVKYSKTTQRYYDYAQQKIVISDRYEPVPLPESIKFAGTFALTNDKIEATFEGNVRNAASFTPRVPLAIGSTATVGSYAFSDSGKTLTIKLGDDRANVYEFVNGQIASTTTYGAGRVTSVTLGAYTSMSEYLASSGPYLSIRYAYVDGKGSYNVTKPTIWDTNGGNLEGTLTYADESIEDSTQWLDIDGKLTFLADFANLPAATISLSADRTGWRAGKGTATVSYKNVLITVDGEAAKAEGQSESAVKVAILVDVADKGRLEIYPDTASDAFRGTVKVDSKIVGNIKSSKTLDGALVVTYQDSTFESVAF